MKGQAMAVMKMLIGAVFAIALLSIVYSTLDNIGCPYSSFDEMKDLISQAAKVDGKCFKKDLVCFDNNAIVDASSLQRNLPGLAVSGVSGNGGGFACSSSTKCTFESKMSVPVSANCNSGTCRLYLNSASCTP